MPWDSTGFVHVFFNLQRRCNQRKTHPPSKNDNSTSTAASQEAPLTPQSRLPRQKGIIPVFAVSITNNYAISYVSGSHTQHSTSPNDFPLRPLLYRKQPDTTSLPLGEKATEQTQSEWPSSVWSAAPVTASQSCTVSSYDPDTTSLLLGEKATESTRPHSL